MTHDYKRNGTTTLFAALNVLDGTVIGRSMQRHRHQEFIRFLNVINAQVPADRAVHIILDNYAAHKHPMVRFWLDRHNRFTFPFTPTSCSWLNAVEGFFAKLSKPLSIASSKKPITIQNPSPGPPTQTKLSLPSKEGTKR